MRGILGEFKLLTWRLQIISWRRCKYNQANTFSDNLLNRQSSLDWKRVGVGGRLQPFSAVQWSCFILRYSAELGELRRCRETGLGFVFTQCGTLQKQCSSAETLGRGQHAINNRESADKIQIIPRVKLACVNTVTSIALHGRPTLSCFCNISWLSQQEPHPAIL